VPGSCCSCLSTTAALSLRRPLFQVDDQSYQLSTLPPLSPVAVPITMQSTRFLASNMARMQALRTRAVPVVRTQQTRGLQMQPSKKMMAVPVWSRHLESDMRLCLKNLLTNFAYRKRSSLVREA
jgi:hypothetical protein